MPRGTTPLPLQSGQATPSWAAIALRMNALLFGNLFNSSASSLSTLKATTAVFGGLRDMAGVLGKRLASILNTTRRPDLPQAVGSGAHIVRKRLPCEGEARKSKRARHQHRDRGHAFDHLELGRAD